MKIIVNVARRTFDTEWHACEAVRLVELDDGSFDLLVSRDLAATLEREKAKQERGS